MTADVPPTHDSPVEEPSGATEREGSDRVRDTRAEHARDDPRTHTRLSGYWAAIVVGLVVLLVLIVFILENSQKVKVSFFGAHAHLAEGVALLLASVIGGLVVVLAGAARILQLRARARRTARTNGRRRRKR